MLYWLSCTPAPSSYNEGGSLPLPVLKKNPDVGAAGFCKRFRSWGRPDSKAEGAIRETACVLDCLWHGRVQAIFHQSDVQEMTAPCPNWSSLVHDRAILSFSELG